MDDNIKPRDQAGVLIAKGAFGNNRYIVRSEVTGERYRTEVWMSGELAGTSYHASAGDAIREGESLLEKATISELGGLS